MEINENTIAVVTGAASGMGAASSQALRAKGAKVFMLDKNLKACQVFADEIGGIAIECDVTSEQSVINAFDEVKKNGCPRIIVNCAGIAPAKRVIGREGPMALNDFSQVININLIGSFNVLNIGANAMSAFELGANDNERGVIINTASVAAFEGQIGQAAYSASKGGIVAMTLPIAREFAKFAIRVNTIAPGLIATPMLLNMPEEVQASLAQQVPFPARLGKPEEFANLMCHIVENELINGETIRLDGAIRMQAK